MPRPKTNIAIDEPIDFARLSQAYRRLKWRWHNVGIPHPEKLEQAVNDLKRSAEMGQPKYCGSGGIVVDRGVVYVHRHLFTFYVLPVPEYGPEAVGEEGDWASKIC